MALILPCLYSELEGQAMPNILEHLKQVPYLSQIIIGLDRANEQQYREALQFFSISQMPFQRPALFRRPALQNAPSTTAGSSLWPSTSMKVSCGN